MVRTKTFRHNLAATTLCTNRYQNIIQDFLNHKKPTASKSKALPRFESIREAVDRAKVRTLSTNYKAADGIIRGQVGLAEFR